MFQSTHPRRVRLSFAQIFSNGIMFQSTHPRRVRPHIQQMSEYHITKVYYLRIICKFLNTYVNLMGI